MFAAGALDGAAADDAHGVGEQHDLEQHRGRVFAMDNLRKLRMECAVVGEDVIVTKADCPLYDKLGEIWKVRADGDRLRVSVSINGDIYSFNLEDLALA